MANRIFPSIEKMSLPELAALRRSIDAALQKRVAVERKNLQSQLDELEALNGGLPHETKPSRRVAEKATVRRGNPLKGKKAAPKYRGPNGETWAGRGLAPRWLTSLEGQGKKRDSFLVKR